MEHKLLVHLISLLQRPEKIGHDNILINRIVSSLNNKVTTAVIVPVFSNYQRAFVSITDSSVTTCLVLETSIDADVSTLRWPEVPILPQISVHSTNLLGRQRRVE